MWSIWIIWGLLHPLVTLRIVVELEEGRSWMPRKHNVESSKEP